MLMKRIEFLLPNWKCWIFQYPSFSIFQNFATRRRKFWSSNRHQAISKSELIQKLKGFHSLKALKLIKCKYFHDRTLIIIRLDSGIFWSEWKSNLNSSDGRASKIIWNHTKLEPISWELNAGNPLLIICVGVWVGGHPPNNFSYISRYAQ